MRLLLIPVYLIQLAFFLAVGALAAGKIEERATMKATAATLVYVPVKQLTEIGI
jgi:hypothetical protein